MGNIQIRHQRDPQLPSCAPDRHDRGGSGEARQVPGPQLEGSSEDVNRVRGRQEAAVGGAQDG
eukprot:8625416-Pyramimonas_sp.AAC.1